MSFIQNLFGNSEFNNDEEFVEAVRKRSDKAAYELQRRSRKLLRSMVLADDPRAFDWVEINDILQEGFKTLYRLLDENKYTPRPDVRFHSYFLGICKNVWRNMIAQKNRQIKTYALIAENHYRSSRTETYTKQLSEDQQEKIKKLLAQAGEICKEILKRFYYYQQKFDEIEVAMGFAPNTGRQKKARCIQKLKGRFFNET